MARLLTTDGYGTALDYVRFFLLMLSSEATLLRQLFSGYRAEQNMTLALHLMMDMEHAYPGAPPPYYPFEEQVHRLGHLVDLAESQLVGLVAFDPRREDSQKIVEAGMALGNCGVKIYPPMGYHPFGNDDLQRTRFQRLYEWCVTNNTPVLTHCTAEGFQAFDGSGVLSDPGNWEEVLDAFPELKLCYGHAGGGEAHNYPPQGDEKVKYPGWCASVDEWGHERNFARKVVEHCLSRPNVYCDFSHIHEILDSTTMAENFKRNLINAFERSDGAYAFSDKAMYGSDWHMPRMSRRVGDYLDHMIELFDSSETLSRHKDKFFYQNALKFLDLERNVERHRFMSGGSISARTLTALADRGN